MLAACWAGTASGRLVVLDANGVAEIPLGRSQPERRAWREERHRREGLQCRSCFPARPLRGDPLRLLTHAHAARRNIADSRLLGFRATRRRRARLRCSPLTNHYGTERAVGSCLPATDFYHPATRV